MIQRRQHKSSWRGAAQLATEAVVGLTDLVEAIHARIAFLPAFGTAEAAQRTRGISGLVYRSVRAVTRTVGDGTQSLLGWLERGLSPDVETDALPRREREALRSVLNGVIGDYLAETANPLAIPMRFRTGGRPLTLEREALCARLPDAGPRPLILLHGLCMNDLQWQRDGHDHGAALARDAGFTPVYLHYNSGLSIAVNGRLLALQLEQLCDAWPVPIHSLSLLGHSMGGLLARSALHFASTDALRDLRWPKRVRHLVCLGSPHHGAPLEAAGHLIASLLGATPFASPLGRLAQRRSAGIKDLRKGNLTGSVHHAIALPDGPYCFAVAANLKAANPKAATHLLGDGLVSGSSALGRHRHAARRLAFPPEHQAVIHTTGHLGLLSSVAVYRQILRWLNPPEGED